jgi:DNA-binding NtrC family response regulator
VSSVVPPGDALRCLGTYAWLGNVRELQNEVRALALAEASALGAGLFMEQVRHKIIVIAGSSRYPRIRVPAMGSFVIAGLTRNPCLRQPGPRKRHPEPVGRRMDAARIAIGSVPSPCRAMLY